nr:hypothetical protein GCM10020185_26610 [Pseudomonas brassicacearum subsp. brassicacearum]
MAGKKITEKKRAARGPGRLKKYSRKIWLAGLGVYSKIDTDGSKLFESLVKDGEKGRKKLTKTAVGKQVDAAKDSAESAKSRIGGVKDRALGKWDELEGAFDKRLNSAISRLGVPSRNEVKALHSKVDTLTKQIEKNSPAPRSHRWRPRLQRPSRLLKRRPSHWSRLRRNPLPNLRRKQRPSPRLKLLRPSLLPRRRPNR